MVNSSITAMDIVARLGQFILATVAVGTNGAVLAKYEVNGHLIFAEALAAIALVTSIIRLFIPMKWSLSTFLYDLLQLVAWAVALGFLASELRSIQHCGYSSYHYYNFNQGGKCGLVKSTTTCAFLSIFAWLVSFVLGAGWSFYKVSDWRAAKRAANRGA